MAEHPVKETDEEGNPICGRHLQYREEHCTNPPGLKTDHEGEGACFQCGGNTGGPEGNSKAMTYGSTLPPSKYFDNLEQSQQKFVIDIYRSYMADAPFGYENFAMSSEVWLCAIDRHKKLVINDMLSDDGLMVQEDKIGPNGEIYEEDKENPLLLAYHRLERDVMSKLQKLGVLDDHKENIENGEMSVSVSIHGVDEDGDPDV